MKLRIPLIIANIIFISMIGLIETAHMADSITFAIVPLLICCLILIFDRSFHLVADKRNVVWDIIFAVLFVVMLSAEDVLKTMRHMGSEPFYLIVKTVFFPLLLVSLFIDVDYALYKAADMKAGTDISSEPSSEKDRFLGIYYPVWMFIALTFVFVIAYFPGLMNSDFEKQLIWGEGPTQWSDWHTVAYMFFTKLCTAVIHKPFMITVVQVLMYYLTANYAVGMLKRRFPGYKKAGWVFICLYMCFGFFSCMYMSEVRKDNCSTPMMLAFAVSLADYILSSSHTKREYVNLAVFAFLASCFRHSLLAIVLITLVCVIAGELSDRRKDKHERKKNIAGLCIVFATTVAAYLIMTEGIAFGILHAERNPAYVKYTIPMNLAASMAYRSRETGLHIDDDIVEKMEQVIPMEKWAEYYCPFDADTTARPWHEIGDDILKLNDPAIAKDIIKVDWYYLTHYPKQCILSFFDVNSIVWEIAVAQDLVMYSPGLANEHYEIHHMRKGEFFHITESMKKYMGSSAIGRAIVYRGGLYLYLLSLISVILFKKKKGRLFAAMLPVLMYALALMISIPQEGSHYIMVFPLFAALFGVIAYASENGNEKDASVL